MNSSVIDHGHTDREGRPVTLRPIGPDNWREIADVAPRDDQREFVAALAARYLLLSTLEDDWHSLGIYAGGEITGHVMWGIDDDAAWIGGMVVDAAHQSSGIGRASLQTLIRHLTDHGDRPAIRLSYQEHNPAGKLYTALGFVPTGETDGDELIAELRP